MLMGSVRRSVAVATALTVGAAACLASSASAESFISSDLKTVKTDDGLRVKVGGFSFGRQIRRFDVLVTGDRTDAVYEGKSQAASKKRFVAKHESLGTIRLSFSPRSSETKIVRRVNGYCGDTDVELRRRAGVFRGKLELHGENDYLDIDETKVPGKQTIAKCVGGARVQRAAAAHSQPERRGSNKKIILINCGPQQSVIDEFIVTLPPGNNSKPQFYADMIENLGDGLRAFKNVKLRAPVSTFTYANDLTSATLTPPAPFAGTGSFTGTGPNNFKTGPLTGDLTVSFLGTPDVAMTPANTDLARTNSDAFCT